MRLVLLLGVEMDLGNRNSLVEILGGLSVDVLVATIKDIGLTIFLNYLLCIEFLLVFACLN